jgi:hypothetical protein
MADKTTEEKAGVAHVDSTGLLESEINNLILELTNKSNENNRRYATDYENQMRIECDGGVKALELLMERLGL